MLSTGFEPGAFSLKVLYTVQNVNNIKKEFKILKIWFEPVTFTVYVHNATTELQV